jgi:predicted SprT family Zn-dependent metalloprotease
MRHKTITLCPTSYEIAKKMPNFSKWIRDQLLQRQGITSNGITQWAYECAKCQQTFISRLNKETFPCKLCSGSLINSGVANRWSGEE